MTTSQRFAAILAMTTWFLSGCALVPGSNLPTNDKQVVGEVKDNISEQVEIHPITFDLIGSLKKPLDALHANPMLEAAIANYEYKVGKGDILNIIVYEHDELTIPAGSYRSASESGTWVHSDGTIYFPYVGKLKVTGLTLEQIRSKLSTNLGKYIEDVKVDVNVAKFNSQRVYITGEINNPGVKTLSNIPLTLLEAINASGGLTDKADWRNVVLSRRGINTVISLEAMLQHGMLIENRLLQANDIVHVPRNDSLKVFVLGEVMNASSLTMGRTRMRLAEALSAAGGIREESADATGVFVIRRSDDNSASKANVFQLNLSDASAFVLGAEFELAPYDVVYVTAAPIELWNRVVNQLIPTLNVYDLLNRSFTITTKN